MDLPATTTFTSPAATNITVWDALQKIADANNLGFDVDCRSVGSVTFYPPSDEAIMHPAVDTTQNIEPRLSSQKRHQRECFLDWENLPARPQKFR